jgi:hypothetical protein
MCMPIDAHLMLSGASLPRISSKFHTAEEGAKSSLSSRMLKLAGLSSLINETCISTFHDSPLSFSGGSLGRFSLPIHTADECRYTERPFLHDELGSIKHSSQ